MVKPKQDLSDESTIFRAMGTILEALGFLGFEKKQPRLQERIACSLEEVGMAEERHYPIREAPTAPNMRPSGGMCFVEALEAMRAGKKVRRKGCRGHLFIAGKDIYDYDNILQGSSVWASDQTSQHVLAKDWEIVE